MFVDLRGPGQLAAGANGIVSSLFDQYPSVERMAEKLSTRDTRFETWEADDPNRAMTLEETPWLRTARGGDEEMDDLINVLDPKRWETVYERPSGE